MATIEVIETNPKRLLQEFPIHTHVLLGNGKVYFITQQNAGTADLYDVEESAKAKEPIVINAGANNQEAVAVHLFNGVYHL